MGLAFKIALRFLFSSKGQTVLIALGISVGVSVQIFIGSLIEGLQDSLLDTTIGRASHITVSAQRRNTYLEDANDYIEILENNISSTGISPEITGAAFLIADDGEDVVTEQILVRGFEFDRANQIYRFDEALTEGSLPDREGEIAIGKGIAQNFGITTGDEIDFSTPSGEVFTSLVTGIFDFNVANINESWTLTTMDYSASIFDAPEGSVSSIEVQVPEPFEADEISAFLSGMDRIPDSVRVTNWKEQNQELLDGLSGQSTSSLMIQIFVIISVVLGIASVLAITVLQKSRQIGILKAMGIPDRTSAMVFLFQGMVLGVMGGILGILLGTLLLFTFSTFAVQSDGTPVVPIIINIRFMAFSGGIAIVAATLAASFSARKSGKLTPIEVIKNG